MIPFEYIFFILKYIRIIFFIFLNLILTPIHYSHSHVLINY